MLVFVQVVDFSSRESKRRRGCGISAFTLVNHLPQNAALEQRLIHANRMKHSPDWTTLPPEVLASVFEQLPIKDLGRVAKVCRAWNRATHFPQLWQEFEFVLSNASK